MAQTDCWATWLAQLRTTGEPELRQSALERLATWRERILDNAGLETGDTLVDVGCGEGLVAFGALERGATVVFADISQDLLDFCRKTAEDLDVLHRARFVRAAAEDLSPIADESVDVVTTRSVLIYVADKPEAFCEFFRVLKHGGRISLFEPINRLARTDRDTWMGYDLSEIGDIGPKIRGFYERLQPRESDPMFDFDERDLVVLAEDAGFFPVHLQLDVAVERPEPRSWDMFMTTPPNPCVPKLAETIEQALTDEERRRLVAHLRPLVEEGRGVSRSALAYVSGVKPRIAESGVDWDAAAR